MLVISRKLDESVELTFGDVKAVIKVVSVVGNRVKLGIEAPLTVDVLRSELVQPDGSVNRVPRAAPVVPVDS